jgi:hypothetical protein
MAQKYFTLDDLARMWSHKPLQHEILNRNIDRKKKS